MAPAFKDENIFIVVPGESVTLAQWGIPEVLAPAQYRFKTRMYASTAKGQFEPTKVRKKQPEKPMANGVNGTSTTHPTSEDKMDTSGDGTEHREAEANGEKETQEEYEEDPDEENDAISPISQGKIVNYPCFWAFLTHIFHTVRPSFHTPVMFVLQPGFTDGDKEQITRFLFEKYSIPALTFLDAAHATVNAFGTLHATVIDVGYDKTDITSFADGVLNVIGRETLPESGGEAITWNLLRKLEHRGFSNRMCEQLKQSSICEVLPMNIPLPEDGVNATPRTANPAAAASTGLPSPIDGKRGSLSAQGGIHPMGPGAGTVVGEADQDREVKNGVDNDGVLDVASLVVSGQVNDFVAKKEKEKQDKAAAKKGAAAADAAARLAALPNSKKVTASFHYRRSQVEEELPDEVDDNKDDKTTKTLNADGSEKPAISERGMIQVGVERLQPLPPDMIPEIADAIYRVIEVSTPPELRSAAWNNLIIVGNGSKVKGFKEALLQYLESVYIAQPPQNNTIFNSSLPSGMTTPVRTGASTPNPLQSASTPSSSTPQQPSQQHGGVNPLLLAATTSHLAPPGHAQPSSLASQLLQHSQQQQQQQQQSPTNPALPQSNPQPLHPMRFPSPLQPSSHLSPPSQNLLNHLEKHPPTSHSLSSPSFPTSIRLAKFPEYFSAWREDGPYEAVFLGAMLGAKQVFVVGGDRENSKREWMSRGDYNEAGPRGWWARGGEGGFGF